MKQGGVIMGEIGLKQERVIEMLTERGVDVGQPNSAKKLREAIADVIAENNIEIEKKISEVVSRELSNEIKRYTSNRSGRFN